MFLLVLNERQSAAFLKRPWLSLAIGGSLTAIAACFGGLSWYLLVALALPLLECVLRYGSRPRVPTAVLLPAAIAVLISHAVFLAFMQASAVGPQKIAVNIAYVSTVLVGAGLGALLYRRAIAVARPSEHAR
jgi:hypothetical protein